VRTLPKSHADYHVAVKKLTSIFAVLKTKEDITKLEFSDLLDKWGSDFSSCQIGKTSIENITLLGNVLSKSKSQKKLHGKPIVSSQTLHALENIKQEPQLSSVWNIKLFSHLQQGI